MNARLTKLFEQYEFSQKDIQEFLQIYDLLPNGKKVKALENFDQIYSNIMSLKQDLYRQHELLFGTTLDSIEKQLMERKKQSVHTLAKENIKQLKSFI